MDTGVLWREEVQKLHDANIPTSSSSHMYADNCAMQLVRQPKQFDVIVTDNLFGDILSDCAAMLTGSLGMLPSASLGAPDADRPPQGALRAGPRLGARHRRQGPRQSARLPAQLRHDAALFLRPRRGGGPARERRSTPCWTQGYRTADIAAGGDAKCRHPGMGDAVLKELDRSPPDPPGAAMAARKDDLYDEDFYAWTQHQAAALRRLAAEHWNGPLDLERLAEEVEDLGSERRDAVLSLLERLLLHLLKLEYSPGDRPRRGWLITVRNARAALHRRLTGTLARRRRAAARRQLRHRAAQCGPGTGRARRA